MNEEYTIEEMEPGYVQLELVFPAGFEPEDYELVESKMVIPEGGGPGTEFQLIVKFSPREDPEGDYLEESDLLL